MDEQMKAQLERAGIDPKTVIDGTVEHSCTYMWRTPQAWPIGGTYEAAIPRSMEDRMVGSKATETLTVEIVGTHPESTNVVFASHEGVRSTVTVVNEGDWVFTE